MSRVLKLGIPYSIEGWSTWSRAVVVPVPVVLVVRTQSQSNRPHTQKLLFFMFSSNQWLAYKLASSAVVAALAIVFSSVPGNEARQRRFKKKSVWGKSYERGVPSATANCPNIRGLLQMQSAPGTAGRSTEPPSALTSDERSRTDYLTEC